MAMNIRVYGNTIKYKEAKIYGLLDEDDTVVYVGSTLNKSLEFKLAEHKKSKTKTKIDKELREYSDLSIRLIIDYPCMSKKDLIAKEEEIKPIRFI